MEELYEQLRNRHNLPAFDVMDREFEISEIDDDAFMLRSIRKNIADKIESAIKIFDELFHPDSGFASFREANAFTETDRERMLDTYKRLRYFYRLSTELSFDDSDELNAEFMNSFMKEWPELKKSVLSFVRKLKESWQKDITKKEVVGYLG
ncbi:hypothetical protein KY359_03065 [Candidatus Woesearchaeota archaeon]|nr:hypothetical protein [Candidatus Woesearchaeota archaeon]